MNCVTLGALGEAGTGTVCNVFGVTRNALADDAMGEGVVLLVSGGE